MSAKSVKLQGVSKKFIDDRGVETEAVRSIDLEIPAGTFATLLGPSGCGKTTILRMIAGFEDPSEGVIYFGDEQVNLIPPNKRDCTMVFQSYALFPHMSVYENVAYGLKIKGLGKSEIANRVHAVLEMMNLQEYGERMPSQLSGGQQQRIALARALVMEPSVLLFDEPLSNLDAKLRITMRDEIRRLQQRLGITTIYVTHDQSEAMSMSDVIIVMNKGAIEQIGSPQEIYLRPKTKFVADFIGTANFLQGRVMGMEEDTMQVKLKGANDMKDLLRVPKAEGCAIGDDVVLIARPEAIKLGSGPLTGIVVKSVFMGRTQEYEIAFGEWSLSVSVANPANEPSYAQGSIVSMEIPIDSLHCLTS